uniref:Uncharacterized protein n=1 Tax=Arundo donax TaxID=35708 RepID=A0A0A9C1E3_ARUDO
MNNLNSYMCTSGEGFKRLFAHIVKRCHVSFFLKRRLLRTYKT